MDQISKVNTPPTGKKPGGGVLFLAPYRRDVRILF